MPEIEWEEGRYLETLEEMQNECLSMLGILSEVVTPS